MRRGRIAVITGASAGVGRATARAFGRAGWRVALVARGVDGLEAARREIEALGGEAMVIPTDVAKFDEVEAAAEQVERIWGPIDVWVNDAMATLFCEFQDISPADFERATHVTYLGTVWGTKAALARMRPRNSGTIVQVGSALAYRSIPLQSAYCGAKSAIRGFTDSLRSELIHARSKVHITMVQLSAFNTPQFDWARACIDKRPQPLPPIFQPEIAADGIYWAATHRRRELWVGWPAAKSILANRLFPGLLDHYLARVAYSGQHTDEPIGERTDNLYAPVPGDHGAHGHFDARSTGESPQLWFATHRKTAIGAALAIALAITVLVTSRDRGRRVPWPALRRGGTRGGRLLGQFARDSYSRWR